VALVQIQNAGLKCAACGSLEIQGAKMMQIIAIFAPSYNFVGLYLRLLVMAALRSRCGHFIFALWFLSIFYLVSFLFIA